MLLSRLSVLNTLRKIVGTPAEPAADCLVCADFYKKWASRKVHVSCFLAFNVYLMIVSLSTDFVY